MPTIEAEFTKEIEGYKVEVFRDQYPIDPRVDYDHAGTLSTLDRNYRGDKGAPVFSRIGEFAIWAAERPGLVYVQAANGIIWATRETRYKEFGKGSKGLRQMRNLLKAEAAEWNAYADGEVFWHKVTRADGSDADSCSGFYGMEWAKEAALEALNSSIKWDKEQAAKVAAIMHV